MTSLEMVQASRAEPPDRQVAEVFLFRWRDYSTFHSSTKLRFDSVMAIEKHFSIETSQMTSPGLDDWGLCMSAEMAIKEGLSITRYRIDHA